MKITHKFVKNVPDILEDGVLYVSMEYATAIHKCCCGCGEEVVTPFSPERWKLTFDGKTSTLDPSIGNWSYKCQSHYWIIKNNIVWAPKWTKEQIEIARGTNEVKNQAYNKRTSFWSIFKLLKIK